MKKKTWIIVLITCIIASILGGLSLYTPMSKGAEKGAFSAERAKEHIKEIAKEPHSIYDVDALAKVRTYILQELNELGLDTEVFTYENVEDRNGKIVDINNIYTKIDGKNGEDGKYILLASHYDSSPKKRDGEAEGSLGAADAGYGISTILEILRVIKEQDKPLENGIKILITDGEEMGLLGAKEEMNNNFSLYENVEYVVNIEARGIKGPALMFETSSNNKKVIDLYKKANLPISYSLAADVYSKMPNGSDFSEFKKMGLQGINFAVLNSLDYYHTPKDNYENVSDTSLQHYGEQILPVVEEFVYNADYGEEGYLDSNEDAIFFTLLPNVFINYSTTIAFGLMILIIVATFLVIRKFNISIRSTLKYTGIWLLIGIISLVGGVVVSYIISLITGMPFKITYMPKVPGDDIILGTFLILLTILTTIFIGKISRSSENKEGIIIGSIGFNIIFLVVTMFTLKGASYLFLWPAVISLIIFGLLKKGINKLIAVIPAALSIIMFVPVIWNIYIALTIGALGVVLLLAIISLTTIIAFINYIK